MGCIGCSLIVSYLFHSLLYVAYLSLACCMLHVIDEFVAHLNEVMLVLHVYVLDVFSCIGWVHLWGMGWLSMSMLQCRDGSCMNYYCMLHDCCLEFMLESACTAVRQLNKAKQESAAGSSISIFVNKYS